MYFNIFADFTNNNKQCLGLDCLLLIVLTGYRFIQFQHQTKPGKIFTNDYFRLKYFCLWICTRNYKEKKKDNFPFLLRIECFIKRTLFKSSIISRF